MQDNASVKSKLINLINSVRTLMRSELRVDMATVGKRLTGHSTAHLPERLDYCVGHCFWLSYGQCDETTLYGAT